MKPITAFPQQAVDPGQTLQHAFVFLMIFEQFSKRLSFGQMVQGFVVVVAAVVAAVVGCCCCFPAYGEAIASKVEAYGTIKSARVEAYFRSR